MYEMDENMINRITIIYIQIIEQMQPFLEPFSELEEGTEEHLVDPTNIACERAFGLLKYAEKHLQNLQFGLLASHAVAKFNRLDLALDYYDSSILEEIHANIAIIEKHLKEQQRDQAAHKVESPRRNRDQLKYIPIRFLLSSSSRVKSKSNDSSQHQSKSKNIERCCQNQICLTEVKKDKNLTF